MRVNLLKKSEQRYQGAVSRRFLLTTVVTTILLIVVLFSVIFCMSWQARRHKVRRMLAQMEDLTPKVEAVDALDKTSKHNNNVRGALNEWAELRPEWSAVLKDIQFQVPESIQVNALNLLTEKMPDGIWVSKLQMNGVAQSSQPEDVVVRFRRGLLTLESLQQSFDSVKLVSFNRIEDPESKQEKALFSIMGTGTLTRVKKTPAAGKE